MKNLSRFLVAFSGLAASAAGFAHVSLEEPRAEAGRPYRAVLRIGHGCDKAATTSVSARLPAGFQGAKPEPKPGWSVNVQGDTATWTAATKEASLPDGQRGEFVVTGTLPRTAGLLWFKVLQTCEQGSLDWAQVPAEGTSTAGMKTPAALLQVLSPADFALAQSLPKVEGAWARSTVPGQQGTGAFMRLNASKPMQLVGVSTPVAGTAEVHEMKMEGSIMRMRAVPHLDLPAGQTTELKPGGYHIMLLDLKQPLAAGSVVPLTLLFRDASGAQSKLEVKVPVATTAPGGAAAPTDGHKH
ncbi:copper chaperone PCu(A)C [Ramlibacter sp. WS9]|uniref:copper chaperone PCu(A)C n=1 Tax=Ramlibacter sp. WS9 TaxID=1882741 RepID=UPI001143A4DB|nr:copper chaperone PCu(A)C [Ramlibacter sp. WS9]ROZ79044.1 copper chaperone PCu(A)C [Ramlibacter sp. WS9]